MILRNIRPLASCSIPISAYRKQRKAAGALPLFVRHRPDLDAIRLPGRSEPAVPQHLASWDWSLPGDAPSDSKRPIASDRYRAACEQALVNTVPTSYIKCTPSISSSFVSTLSTIPIETWITPGSPHVTDGDNEVARGNVLPLQPTIPPLDSYLKIVVLRPDEDLNWMDWELEQSGVHTIALPRVSVANTSSCRLQGGAQAARQPMTATRIQSSRI